MEVNRHIIPFGAEPLELEFGRVAKQADAAVTARVGGTVLLAAVTRSEHPIEERDFFPLMVDYREKFYASGRIPGGFFKREGRPGDIETLRARLIDRAIRPLFPEGMRNEVMVYVTVISSDNTNPAEIAAFNAVGLALHLSSIPFDRTTAAVRIGRVDGQFILNPTLEQMQQSELDLIVAGTRKALTMVESGANELDEATMQEALRLAHEHIQEIVEEMDTFAKGKGKDKFTFTPPSLPEEVNTNLEKTVAPECEALVGAKFKDKVEFSKRHDEIVKAALQPYQEEHPEWKNLIKSKVEQLLSQSARKQVLDQQVRVDGRKLDEIRPIKCEAPILPATHGSALFTRGQTQALGVVTLGTVGDAQMIDVMEGTWDKNFLLQYNFPPYSVGEARPMRAPGRREIGHGALAERALEPVVPQKDQFPYTIRIVSEILESNGSSSMASVCAGCLALMDAGVPVKAPVAGIAMGLVADAENDRMEVLTDIQGLEDHLGDMDFKVAGTTNGITALQMDIKISGVSGEVLERALAQARQARLEILEKMGQVLPGPREELALTAPRVTILQIDREAIGSLIGPGGKTIRGIQEKTGAQIDVEEDGKVYISSPSGEAAKAAEDEIRALTTEIEVGQVFEGKVVRVTDFGAFVQLTPNKDGMVHISELDIDRVPSVEAVCKEGDPMKVMVTNVDPSGKIRLSRKVILMREQGYTEEAIRSEMEGSKNRSGGGSGRGGRGGGSRGGGRDRDGRSRGGGRSEYGFREKPRSNK